MYCKKCGTEYDGGECPNCGEIRDGMMKCPSCYAIIKAGSVVCPRCGYMSPEHYGAGDTTKSRIKMYEAWSVFSGLVSLVLSILVFVDASTLIHSLGINIAVGLLYVMTSVLLLLGGVVSVIQHHRDKKILFFLTFVYGLCSLLCFVQIFCGLSIGASLVTWWSLICCVTSVVSALRH